MHKFEILREKARFFNIELNDLQIGQFKEYFGFLEEFNRHTNLISSSSAETVEIKHFLDSLSMGLASNEMDLNRNLSIIDVGTGGGFPGIPLMIAFPCWRLCAVDSIAKKLEFLRIISDKLGFAERTEIISARAEELGRVPGRREGFDLAVTRAVARINVISEYCLPLVKINGHFAAYKAKTVHDELKEAQKAISDLGGTIVNTYKYTLTGDDDRNLVLIKKTGHTSGKYPRRTGIPAKRPIG